MGRILLPFLSFFLFNLFLYKYNLYFCPALPMMAASSEDILQADEQYIIEKSVIIMIDNPLDTIEELIAIVLSEIRAKGFSIQPPFEIGVVEERMKHFAVMNGIMLASDSLYMSAKQLQHCMRQSKEQKELVVDDSELIRFPKTRFAMDLYYDGECFIYTNGRSKFIIHPNYEIKISRNKFKVVNFIKATKAKDKKEFNGKRYIKIETDRPIK